MKYLYSSDHPMALAARLLGVALAYLVLGYAVRDFIPNSELVSVVWPSSGVALAAVLMGGPRYVVAVIMGSLAVGFFTQGSLAGVLGIALVNALEAYLGYWLLSRLRHYSSKFESITDYLYLCAVGATACAVSALLGTVVLFFSGDITADTYNTVMNHRWMGHTIGVALVTSLILSWRKWPVMAPRRLLEAAFLLGLSVMVGQVVFLNWLQDSVGHVARGYWMFLAVTTLAIRAGTRFVTLAVIIAGVQALMGALQGTGFFSDDIEKSGLNNYWYYTLTLSLVGMTVATHVSTINRYVRELLQLRRQEQKMTHLLNQMGHIANVGGWELDLSTMNLVWTEEVYRIHEMDPSVVPELSSVINFYAPQARQHVEAALHEAMTHGTPWDLELPLISAKGRHIWVRTVGSATLEEGQVVRLNGAFQDVTLRRSMAQELQASAHYVRSLLEASPDPLVTISTQGKVTDVNAATEHATGVARQQLIGSDFARYFTEPERANAGYQQAFEDGYVKDYPLVIRHVSGTMTDVLYNASVYRDAAGQVAGVFAAARDVTEQKKVMNALQQANADLEGFSYSVSHDLRTPLRAIDGFSRMLIEDYTDVLDDEGRRLLNVVRNNTERMATLIDDILHFSRAGRIDMSRSAINVNDLVQRVIEDLHPLIGERELEFDIQASLPQVHADRGLLHQVFENLISNAIKFTAPSAHAKVTVQAQVADAQVVFVVRDNGVGFDMKYVGKLFGVFQRLHGIEEFEGTGIGLAIAKRIVNRHGGRIWAESKLGLGANFYFTLPYKEKIA